jgi:hypothetical protein
MDYRDPLGQAHERIARLEEELAGERAKNAPRPPRTPPIPPAPVATTAPRARVPLLRFWSLPLAVVSAIPLAVHRLPFESSIDPADVDGVRLVLGGLVASSLLFALEALVRTQAGRATMGSRLLLVGAGVLGLPAGLVAATAGVTIVGIAISVGAAIFGLVKLARWTAKGSST